MATVNGLKVLLHNKQASKDMLGLLSDMPSANRAQGEDMVDVFQEPKKSRGSVACAGSIWSQASAFPSAAVVSVVSSSSWDQVEGDQRNNGP